MRKPSYNSMTPRIEEIFDNLRMDDLADKYKEVADIVGFENYMKLVEHFAGDSVYIPKKYELYRHEMYKAILDEYDGTNIKRLAVAYGISEKTIYNILRGHLLKKKKKAKNGQMEGQMSILDLDFYRLT